jgi:hypothetical protein
MRHWRTGGALIALLLIGGIAGAAERADPEAATREALTAAEDVTLLNGVNPLRLTTGQIQALLPLLRGAQSRLQEQETADARSFAGLREMLLQARRQLITEGTTASSAEQQVTLNRQSAGQRQAQLRRDLAAGLRRQLTTTLTASQQAQIVARGRQFVAAERATALQQSRLTWAGQRPTGAGTGGTGAGGPGAGGFGRGGGQGQMFDRIRALPQDQFDQMAQRMASRSGGPGTPEYEQNLSFLQKVRSMPSDAYQQQRDQLGQQLLQSRLQESATDSAEAAMDAFIARYFLSPRIVPLLEEKSKS